MVKTLRASFRYFYLGDKLTDERLKLARCNPVRRADGKCVVSVRMASALVMFEGESIPRVVLRRRLRVIHFVESERGPQPT